MLTADDLATTAARFGVADDQVRRDHLISHLLAALGTLDEDCLAEVRAGYGAALGWAGA
jgi:hypothetical protein